MAELKPFEVIMKVSPIAGLNGKGEVVFRSERQQELVRCKDCTHYDGRYCYMGGTMTARHREFFCAYGEKDHD